MAESIKDKFSGIGSKTTGSTGASTEWNGIVDELVLINASNGVDLGKDTIKTRDSSITVGKGADDTNSGTGTGSSYGINERTAVGNYSRVGDGRATAVGNYSQALSLSSTAVGFGATVERGTTHGQAWGRGSYASDHIPNGHFAIGGNGDDDFYFGTGFCHKHPSIRGTSIGDKTPSNVTKRFHGQDAYDGRFKQWVSTISYGLADYVYDNGKSYYSIQASNLNHAVTDTAWWALNITDSNGAKEDDNTDAGHVALCGGIPTGSGLGGYVDIETASGGAVGAGNKKSLVTQARFDTTQSGVDTRFLLLDVTDGTLKRVQFGADDSAGTGFKVLKVEN